jgi:hypothetical protein
MFKTKIKMCTDTNLCKENGCYAITLFDASSLPLRREVFFFFFFFVVKNWWGSRDYEPNHDV